MTTTKEDKEIKNLDPWQRNDYFQAIDLGATHTKAISLAQNLELFTKFLERKIK